MILQSLLAHKAGLQSTTSNASPLEATFPREHRGLTQVKERSTHARPGMHMQQCSAVLTAMSCTALLLAHCASVGRVLAATTSGFNTTYTRTSSLSYRSWLRAGTKSAGGEGGGGMTEQASMQYQQAKQQTAERHHFSLTLTPAGLSWAPAVHQAEDAAGKGNMCVHQDPCPRRCSRGMAMHTPDRTRLS